MRYKAAPFYDAHGRHVCRRCKTSIQGLRVPTAAYCFDCARAVAYDTGAQQARLAVQQAVKRGQLPRPDTQTCVDCGEQAKEYDHRDYGDPLNVEPVCRRCNRLRPTARPALVLSA